MTRKLLFASTTVTAGVLALAATAIGQTAPPKSPPPTSQGQQAAREAREGPRKAIAVLTPTQGNDVTGTVTFEETPQGLRVNANVSGLPGGEHAYHVHVYGDCSAPDGTSAGPHYRFGPADSGITGDLGELAPDSGQARHSQVVSLAKLRGANSIVGRSVVVHAKGNDPSQPPDGAAGARLACGVIGLDEASGASGSSSSY